MNKQMEELGEIKQQLALRNRTLNEEKARKRSTAEAKTAQRLIHKVVSAARLAASHKSSKTLEERETPHANNQSQGTTETELQQKEVILPDSVPEIYVENDIDGRCYLAGPRRQSLRDDNNNSNDHTQERTC